MHSATVNNSKNVASAKVNIFYSDIPSAWWSAMVPAYCGPSGTRALLGGQPCPTERGSSLGPSECLNPSALTGVSVLLVTHEGPVVAQDVHGVLPVPAGTAVVLETGLVSTNSDSVCYRLWKLIPFVYLRLFLAVTSIIVFPDFSH